MDRRLQRRSRKKKKNPIPEDDDEGGGADDSNGKSRPGSSSLMRQLSFEFLPEHSIVEISIDELKNEMAKTTSPEVNYHLLRLSITVHCWASCHSQGFEDKNLGSSPGLLGQ